MTKNDKDPAGSSPAKDTRKLDDLWRVMETMERKLSQLVSTAFSLPNVDEKGYSECPFADKLYLEAQDAYDNVTRQNAALKEFLFLLDKELSDINARGNQIATDKAALKTDSAREQYQYALGAIIQHRQRNMDNRKKLLALIKHVDEMLKEARANISQGKKFLQSSSTRPVSSSNSSAERNRKVQHNRDSNSQNMHPRDRLDEVRSLLHLGRIYGEKTGSGREE